VLSIWDGQICFEGNDELGKWSFHFRSPAVVKAGVWSHLAVVVEAGKGVVLYCNGNIAAKLDNPKKRRDNTEPLVLGREAWNGDHNGQPCFYGGLMDQPRVWARPLSAGEVQAECENGRPTK
jgi:hypothetical protein